MMVMMRMMRMMIMMVMMMVTTMVKVCFVQWSHRSRRWDQAQLRRGPRIRV